MKDDGGSRVPGGQSRADTWRPETPFKEVSPCLTYPDVLQQCELLDHIKTRSPLQRGQSSVHWWMLIADHIKTAGPLQRGQSILSECSPVGIVGCWSYKDHVICQHPTASDGTQYAPVSNQKEIFSSDDIWLSFNWGVGGLEAKNVLKVIFEAKSVPLLLNNAPRVKRLNLCWE